MNTLLKYALLINAFVLTAQVYACAGNVDCKKKDVSALSSSLNVAKSTNGNSTEESDVKNNNASRSVQDLLPAIQKDREEQNDQKKAAGYASSAARSFQLKDPSSSPLKVLTISREDLKKLEMGDAPFHFKVEQDAELKITTSADLLAQCLSIAAQQSQEVRSALFSDISVE